MVGYNTSMSYIKPGDPYAFIGMEPKKIRDWLSDNAVNSGEFVACPVCQTYGGWNMSIKYGVTNPNTPDDFSLRAFCTQCNGKGWTHKHNAACVHEFVYQSNLGRCFNRYVCTKCEITKDIDSGD